MQCDGDGGPVNREILNAASGNSLHREIVLQKTVDGCDRNLKYHKSLVTVMSCVRRSGMCKSIRCYQLNGHLCNNN